MKLALVTAIVAAAVAAGSALAVGRPAGRSAPRPPHPRAHPHPHARRAPPAAHGPLSHAALQSRIAAWSAAHPGWTNPAGMTHAEMTQAAIDHPTVYAPVLAGKSKSMRIIEQYGTWATMSPQLRAIERAEGIPIPANIPYVPLRAARRP